MGRVSGKIALVSGAASGIGAACARLLAAEGARVMLVDLNDLMAANVLTEIRAAGGEAEYHHLDVTSETGLEAVMTAMEARFNTIHPGFIRTPLLEQSIARFGDAEEGRKFYDNLQPIGHLGEPEDIANGALYLASDESRFVTGAELVIDGGFTAR